MPAHRPADICPRSLKKSVVLIKGGGANPPRAKLFQVRLYPCTKTKLSSARNAVTNSFSPQASRSSTLKKVSLMSPSVASPAVTQRKMRLVVSVNGLKQLVHPAVELQKFPLSRVRTDLYTAASASQRCRKKKLNNFSSEIKKIRSAKSGFFLSFLLICE